MLNKIKRASKYILYAIFTNIIFGLIYYFLFSWLVGYSLLYAYLGCLALIIIGLILDYHLKNSLVSKKTVETLNKLDEKDKKSNYRLLQLVMDSFVSFKTILFVFYIFVLVASQVITIDPTLASVKFNNFIAANSYGLVLVIAFYMIVEQFPKDRQEMKEKSEILRKTFLE